MARQLRIQFPGALYHITSRGNEKKDIFQRDRDREKFIAYLEEGKERYEFLLYAYALTNNHYHLLIETPLANIAQIVDYINTRSKGVVSATRLSKYPTQPTNQENRRKQ